MLMSKFLGADGRHSEGFSPVFRAEDLLRGVDEAGFGMVWRVENLPRVFIRRRHDDEAAPPHDKHRGTAGAASSRQ